jgi:hypothetical protein
MITKIFGSLISLGVAVLMIAHFLMEEPLISQDKSGVSIDCKQLSSVTKSGNMDYISYYFPRVFAMSFKGLTISHYEKKINYSFKSCRSEIELEISQWCSNKTSKINERNVNDVSSFIKKQCGFNQNDWISSYQSEAFETRKGLIKANNKWISINRIEVWEPKKANRPSNGLFEQCFSYDGFAYCKYQKNKPESIKEYQRLLKLMSNNV